MTRYYVLKRDARASNSPAGMLPALTNVGVYEATGPEQAIKAARAETGSDTLDGEQRFVAVPERNWTEIGYASEPQPPKVTATEITLFPPPEVAGPVEPEPEFVDPPPAPAEGRSR